MQSNRFVYTCLFVFALVCLISLSTAKTKSLYDPSKSQTYLLNRDNFDKQITKHRGKHVSIIHFYKYDDEGSESIALEFEKFANEWQGAFRIATVDCFAQYELCEKEKITTLPTVRIYPILPVPPFDYEGDMSSKGWTGVASRFVQSNVLELNGTNINKFLNENPSVPKSLLFTDKPGIPLIWKTLCVAFEKKIFLGIVRSDQEEILTRYNIKKTPTIVIFKPTEKKPKPYEGELKYGKIFDFLNVYTETFVPGGENLDFDKPWNKENFPELTKKSGNDICFGIEGVLCGIYLTKQNPEASISKEVDALLEGADSKYKYMWLNVDSQSEFAGLFTAEELPKLAILSHGKRKKYLIHEGDFTKSSILGTLDKISNGDARFKQIPGELPPLN